MAEDEKPDNMDYYVVRGGMSWGKDESLQTAFFNWFKNERPARDVKVVIHQVAQSATVDDFGRLNWFTKDGEPVKLGEVTVTKKLIERYNAVMTDIDELLVPVEDNFDWDLAMRVKEESHEKA
jgi:hypothetical protein